MVVGSGRQGVCGIKGEQLESSAAAAARPSPFRTALPCGTDAATSTGAGILLPVSLLDWLLLTWRGVGAQLRAAV